MVCAKEDYACVPRDGLASRARSQSSACLRAAQRIVTDMEFARMTFGATVPSDMQETVVPLKRIARICVLTTAYAEAVCVCVPRAIAELIVRSPFT